MTLMSDADAILPTSKRSSSAMGGSIKANVSADAGAADGAHVQRAGGRQHGLGVRHGGAAR